MTGGEREGGDSGYDAARKTRGHVRLGGVWERTGTASMLSWNSGLVKGTLLSKVPGGTAVRSEGLEAKEKRCERPFRCSHFY